MPPNLGRPKRVAEDFARTHHGADFTHQPSKKARFDVRNPSTLAPDALEDDETLDADVIGARGQQIRRGAVNVDGYDSDSENENFNDRADAKAREKRAQEKSEQEEQEDMFADLDENFKDGDESEGDDKRQAGTKKAVRFLDADEIEGQVKNSRSGGHVSADFSLNTNGKGKDRITEDQESSSESEVDDEVRASAENVDDELGAGSKKKHAPKLDAFNMQSENEEGKFDEQGNYVRKAMDPDAVHDSWLDGISKKDMKKAQEAHERREKERRDQFIQDDSESTADILSALIPQLESGETVLEALARLGKNKSKKPKWQTKTKNYKQGDSAIHREDLDVEDSKRKEAIEVITAAADRLLGRGQSEIYENERELLTRQYRRETGQEWSDNSDQSSKKHAESAPPKAWEYRWSDARDGGTIHGPYDGQIMKQWNEAGYFDEKVEFRGTHTNDGWSRLVEFDS